MKNWQARLRRIVTWLLFIGGALTAGYILFLRPTEVIPYRVSKGEVLVEALGTGSVESRQTIDVSFEVTARLVQIHVDQGDRIEMGQELASIDNSTFQAEVAVAEQEVALAESTRQRLDADIERSRAVLKGAEDGLKRIRPLVESGAASGEALDVAEERYKVATAELARSQAAQIEGHAATLAARRRLDRAKTAFARTVVRSPFDGVVLRRVREVGDVAVPGAAVLKIAATDTVWASVWVDETYLRALTIGLPARAALRSEPERTLRGKITRIGREVDRETRELLVDVSFDTPPEMLVFGQRVDTWIELARRVDVVRVPARAVLQLDGHEGAFVADGTRATFRRLELGARGRELIEVTHGLSLDDVVLDPTVGKNKLLKNGQRIRLIEYGEQESSQ